MNHLKLWETITHYIQHPSEIPFNWILLSIAATAMWLIAYRMLEKAGDRKIRYGIGLNKSVKPQNPKQRWDGYEDLM